MTKQRSQAEGRPSPTEVPILADGYLSEIAHYKGLIDELDARTAVEMADVKARYDRQMLPVKALMETAITAIMQTMKFNKAVLFDGTDVVRLPNGSLIHHVAEKVSIPRDALARCEELGFDEVVKIAKSLDRDAVEKWPDERLILIGAERKPKEEFSYDLKKETTGAL